MTEMAPPLPEIAVSLAKVLPSTVTSDVPAFTSTSRPAPLPLDAAFSTVSPVRLSDPDEAAMPASLSLPFRVRSFSWTRSPAPMVTIGVPKGAPGSSMTVEAP